MSSCRRLLDTGCASRRSGWLPRFVLLRRGGALAGAMPLFVKSHSYGEYVFDWAWAEAHERHGVDYYPKALSAIPFTPVRGPPPPGSRGGGSGKPCSAPRSTSRKIALRCMFFSPQTDEAALMEARGMLLRRTVQFHWRNEGYADFDAFLARLSPLAAQEHPPGTQARARGGRSTFRWLEGPGIEARHWEFFNRCYRCDLMRRTARAPISTWISSAASALRCRSTRPWCWPSARRAR